jgi:hypothetical protein
MSQVIFTTRRDQEGISLIRGASRGGRVHPGFRPTVRCGAAGAAGAADSLTGRWSLETGSRRSIMMMVVWGTSAPQRCRPVYSGDDRGQAHIPCGLDGLYPKRGPRGMDSIPSANAPLHWRSLTLFFFGPEGPGETGPSRHPTSRSRGQELIVLVYPTMPKL